MNARFNGTGHGAAACSTIFSDDRSYRSRTSSGRSRMRVKFAGTMCVFVTWSPLDELERALRRPTSA